MIRVHSAIKTHPVYNAVLLSPAVKGRPSHDVRLFSKQTVSCYAVVTPCSCYLALRHRNAFFQDFAKDAIITTALGQKLTDLKKFEDAIKKYEGVQTAAKKLVR